MARRIPNPVDLHLARQRAAVIRWSVLLWTVGLPILLTWTLVALRR